MHPKKEQELPTGDKWLYELKLDGLRSLALKDRDAVRLYSRNQNLLCPRFPEIVSSLRLLDCDKTILGGEIIALDQNGMPSFDRLQQRSRRSATAGTVFYAFDLLHLDGRDTRRLPLLDRKLLLEQLLKGSGIRFTSAFEGDPSVILAEVEKRGLEGVVAKLQSSRYESGRAKNAWIKVKVYQRDTLCVGGFVVCTRRNLIESLLVGCPPAAAQQKQPLSWSAKVNFQYFPRVRDALVPRLVKLRVGKSPFETVPRRRRYHG